MTQENNTNGDFLTQRIRQLWHGKETRQVDHPHYVPSPERGRQPPAEATSNESEDELLRSELDYIAEAKKAKGASTAEHIAAIRAAVDNPRNADPDKNYLFGLALSGGGIRSATFSLGVMQRLAAAGILKHVDYLSTVSGGGYIGSALSWWLSGKSGAPGDYGRGKDDFPYGTADPSDPRATTPILDYLRRNGNYLVPGNGITIWSGIAIVLRAIFLNLFVWIPILTFLFFLLAQADGTPVLGPCSIKFSETTAGSDECTSLAQLNPLPTAYAWAAAAAGLLFALFLLGSLLFSFLSWLRRGAHHRHAPAEKTEKMETTQQFPPHNRLLHELKFLGAAAIYGVIIFTVLFAYDWLNDVSGSDLNAMVGSLSKHVETMLFLSLGFLVVILLGALLLHQRLRDVRFLLLVACLPLVAAVIDRILVGQIPDMAGRGDLRTEVLGKVSVFLFLSVIIGIVLLAIFWLGQLAELLRKVPDISLRYSGRRRFETLFGGVLPVVVALLVFASVPLAVAAADDYFGESAILSMVLGAASGLWGHLQSRGKGSGGRGTTLILLFGSTLLLYGILLVSYRLSLQFGVSPKLTVLMMALALFAVVSGWATNLNYISLHRFYRDRLMEAFLPDYDTVQSGQCAPAGTADGLRLSQLWQANASGPYHLINTNVVLVNSRDRTYRARGGDNFILSPLYCGSSATGWQSTDTFMNDEMTLPTAMAISGAAANPRAGGGGRGLTRNRFVSLAMTLLNLRLGYYVPRPVRRALWQRRPNHFRPGALYSIPWFGYTEDSSFQELSDGGHFENLAFYELVRRRCGLIVVCDGGQDREASYSDFVTALQRIGQDFGATVHFDREIEYDNEKRRSDPKFLIPKPQDPQNPEYPGNAEFADTGFFVATIDYGPARGAGPWPRTGLIIYLKTAMIQDLEMEAKGYKGAHPDFPDETTADQFFSEEQFEAYREIGFHICGQMIETLKPMSAFGESRPPLSVLRPPRYVEPTAKDSAQNTAKTGRSVKGGKTS